MNWRKQMGISLLLALIGFIILATVDWRIALGVFLVISILKERTYDDWR